jgi:hypothetical protein
MALQAIDLFNRLAEMEGGAFADWEEEQIRVRVGHLNGALRRSWRTESPRFAFPFTVAADDVAVTDGVIPANLLGDATWGAFFSEDPRPVGNSARVVEVWTDHEGVHLKDESLGSVFAFYRNAVPQLTYEEGGTYVTPANIPDALLDIVPLDALCALYVGMQQWDGLRALKSIYGQPDELRVKLGLAVKKSRLPWEGHAVALSFAPV